MATILLNDPVPASPRLERLNLFPGRHLGEDEFDRLQAYADARLEPLLHGHGPGILTGLEVSADRVPDAADPLRPYRLGQGFSIAAGMAVAGNGQAVGLYYPIHQSWETLIEAYLRETNAASAAGIYFLTLRRTRFHIDAAAEIDPCQRAEIDPTRDSRLVVLGTVGLRRLALPADVATNASQERIENVVAANCVDGEFLQGFGPAIPLGLLAVEGSAGSYAARWFSPVVGRYLAQPESGYRVLLTQVSEAFRRLINEAQRARELAGGGADWDLPGYLSEHLQLDDLPAAGQLPLSLLQNPAAVTPALTWLPEHLRIDAVAVPDTVVGELIERHLPRRVIDLRQPAGDRLRLLLAVPERLYKPDVLDIPQTDATLENDVYRYSMRAHDSWRRWRRQFDRLYFIEEGADVVLTPEQVRALSLPEPAPPPAPAGAVFEAVIERAPVPEATGAPPYPYNRGVPAPPPAYRDWLADGSPPGVAEPDEDGFVIQYAIGQVELEAVDNQIRILQTRLNKTQDYLLLQRQQLDAQTVSLATLAGGVAGDGSGLQLARWLPYTELKAPPPPVAVDAGAGGVVGDGTEFAQPAPTAQPTQPTTAFLAMPALLTAARAVPLSTKGITATAVAAKTPTFSVLKPATRSAIEFGINTQRLEQLVAPPRQPLTPPALAIEQPPRVGVLSHVQPDAHAYKKVHNEMTSLMAALDGLFDKKETNAVKARLRRIWDTVGLKHPSQLAENISQAALVEHRYSELFKAGQVLTQQIAVIEARYDKLERDMQLKLRERRVLQERLSKLAALIAQERQKLDTFDGERIERLGDYAVTQRLLEEDWRKTFDRNEARTRLLTRGLTGLYYVRVNSAAVSLPLADPLALRHGRAGDIVPGCPVDAQAEIPESLREFFDTVLEVPVADWASLAPLLPKVSETVRVDYAQTLRALRLQTRSKAAPPTPSRQPLQLALGALSQQNLAVIGAFAGHKTPPTSLPASVFNREAAKALSLQDLLTGSAGALRREAQQLHGRLEQCVGCLVEHLGELSPSIRLEWSQLAEDDRLPMPELGRWPGLELAERADFNTVRTLVELVQWWFRQLAASASGAGQSALRNMIRAAVIHAALGDPSEILHGQVQVPPRRLAVGEPLRLKLNKPPQPGTLLQLLDREQRVVGLLTVADSDDKGVLANLVQIDRPGSAVSTGFTVVAGKLTKSLAR